MSEIQGQGAVVRATIHVTRKETGEVETYEVVGRVTEPEPEPEPKEEQ